jgi:hypothetical protein
VSPLRAHPPRPPSRHSGRRPLKRNRPRLSGAGRTIAIDWPLCGCRSSRMDFPHMQSHHRTNGHVLGPAPIRPVVLTPTSASTPTFPSPPSASASQRLSHSLARSGSDEYEDGPLDSQNGDGRPRKKQKRNKPTLSCHECVERKTKVCDFVRPATGDSKFARRCSAMVNSIVPRRRCRRCKLRTMSLSYTFVFYARCYWLQT